MDVVVCVKHVPDPETKLKVAPSGKTFDTDGVKFTINNTYDEATVEEALRMKEEFHFGAVRVVSVGPTRSEEGLRAALAMGCDEAVLIETPPDALLDPMLVSRVLATVIKDMPHDLVMVGKNAQDDEAGQVGSALGEYLGLPSYSFVTGLAPDAASHRLKMHRYIEGGEEIFSGPFPAVLSIQKGVKDPRTPTLPNILKARKKPLKKIPLAEVKAKIGTMPGGPNPTTEVTSFALPPPRAGAKIIEGQTPDEIAQKLIKVLKEEAKVL
jgi:electron transfer flavoprotein beta subunit